MHGQQNIKKLFNVPSRLVSINLAQRDKAAQQQLRRSGDAKSCASPIKTNLRFASYKLKPEQKIFELRKGFI